MIGCSKCCDEEEKLHIYRFLAAVLGSGLGGGLSFFLIFYYKSQSNIFYYKYQSNTWLLVSLWLSLTTLASCLGDKAARLCWNGCHPDISQNSVFLSALLTKEKKSYSAIGTCDRAQVAPVGKNFCGHSLEICQDEGGVCNLSRV